MSNNELLQQWGLTTMRCADLSHFCATFTRTRTIQYSYVSVDGAIQVICNELNKRNIRL